MINTCEHVHKAAPPRVLTPKVLQAQDRIHRKVRTFLTGLGKHIASQVRGHHTKVSKANDPDNLLNLILNIDWEPLVDDLEPDLADVAQDSSTHALAQVNVSDNELISSANDVAGNWAHDRAAELVGMKWDDAGNLIENPDAKWAISDTTRDDIRQLVTDAFSEDTPIEDLADQIQEAGTFSDYRAEMIARTETSLAQGQGNLAGWGASGVVQGVEWRTSSDHDEDSPCDCSDNEDDSPYALDDVPDFPSHPNCWCSLIPVLIPESEL